jgi:F-type H+-transporting ATPase subunit delta
LPAETTIVSGIAGRYATALFDLAKESNQLDNVQRDMDTVAAMLNESADLARLVRSPVVAREDQAKAMAAVLERAGIGDLVRKFVGVVAENRRLFALLDMIKVYGQLMAQHRGEVVADVTAAKSLNDAQMSALKASLAEGLGRDVAVNVHVDDSLIGGLVVQVGSRMIDTSLRTKLENLKYAMKGVG